jgi:hypothetical protein
LIWLRNAKGPGGARGRTSGSIRYLSAGKPRQMHRYVNIGIFGISGLWHLLRRLPPE